MSRRKMPYADTETGGAVVVTLENTSISACSSGSLVSKGRFVGLCLRFTDDFEISWDDWKPDMSDTNLMNLCVVSDGTYEVCSRTIAQKQGGGMSVSYCNKWIGRKLDHFLTSLIIIFCSFRKCKVDTKCRMANGRRRHTCRCQCGQTVVSTWTHTDYADKY